ncbi:MAG TPA: N-glycosylase/DNA lyase [Alphaproteobacteria bacterium]|nr:N-glycosylase/DNA lyase [Alphaproteobacteria bacterium]
MLTHKALSQHYIAVNKTAKTRLKEFKENGKKITPDEMFMELCFCICTPQSKAVKVAEVVNKQNIPKLLTLNQDQLAEFLRRNTRFHNNKARHIINARQYRKDLGNLPKDGFEAREFIVKNIKGVGYKEASHYLRNMGYRELCIIDRHVINIMFELGVYDTDKPPATAKKYLEMERILKEYAIKNGFDVDELDLALWSLKTGHVFK